MKPLFFIISLFPKTLFISLVDLYTYTKIYKLFSSYKITKVNLEIAYPDLVKNDVELLSKLSIRESIISAFETIYTWGRSVHQSNSQLFKIENNFLLSKTYKEGNGLITVAIHNRSVDMLLKWINSKIVTISLYKKIKIKTLESFVKRNREDGESKSYETSIGGVRKILKALNSRGAICFAADQVPQRGLGEYVKFFNRDAYTTTLVQSLAAKTKAPVLFAFINSNKDGFLFTSIKEPKYDYHSDSEHKLLLNKNIEEIINIRPIDYSWEYKRFKKSKPPGTDPYKSI